MKDHQLVAVQENQAEVKGVTDTKPRLVNLHEVIAIKGEEIGRKGEKIFGTEAGGNHKQLANRAVNAYRPSSSKRVTD